MASQLPPEVRAKIAALGESIIGVNASRYTTAAGFTLLIYDWVITFGDEIQMVWPAKWSLVKVLFLMNRWLPPLFLGSATYHLAGYRPALTDLECKLLVGIGGFAQVFCTTCSTWMIVLRVGALYGRSKRLMVPLYILFVASYGCSLGFTIISLKTLIGGLHYQPLVGICSSEQRHPAMSGIFIAPIAFECLVVGLTVYKGWEHAKFMRNVANAPVLFTLYRDGFFYFIVIVALRVWNVTIWFTLPQSMLFLGIYLLWAIITTLISRFFLNLREAAGSGKDWLSADVKERNNTSANADTMVWRRGTGHTGQTQTIGTAGQRKQLETFGGDDEYGHSTTTYNYEMDSRNKFVA